MTRRNRVNVISRAGFGLAGCLVALGAAMAQTTELSKHETTPAGPPAPRVPHFDHPDYGAPLSNWNVTASTPTEDSLTWPKFLQEVLNANLGYAAARYDVDMAAADAAAAKLLPNPTLSLGGDRDLTFHNKFGTGADGQPALLRQVESRNVGITQTLELGGKRKWKGKAADQTLRAAAATLDDFLRNLKLDAASAYADALSAQQRVDRLRAVAGFLKTLSKAQEHRLAVGDIGKPDLTQTQLEEFQFQNDLKKADADAEQARIALCGFLGRDRGQTNFTVVGSLEQSPRKVDLTRLIDTALKQRADLVALRHTRDAAESSLHLAKASRIPDVDVGLTYTHNGGVTLNHPIDPTPAFNQLALSVSVPLPIFDQGQYAVRKAYAASDQAQTNLSAAELKAEVDIRTAESDYRSALDRLATFQHGILDAADKLLEAKRISYQHGASTLLELLEAQRSANEIRQAYDDALADVAKAEIELERMTAVESGVKF
jgi:cobalt-zinc-cadmium efflux system outer membrane protein